MRNSGTVIDRANLKGGLSDELTSCDFYKAASEKSTIGGYLGSPDRAEFRDPAMETYLKAKGCKVNGATMLLLSKDAAKMIALVNDKTTPKEFVELMKKHLERPLHTLWEVFYKSGIKALSPMHDEITKTNIAEIEDAALIFLKMANEGKAANVQTKQKATPRYDFEGRYENTEPGHDKFWEISANANGLFTARWGRNGKAPQGSKDDYTYGEAEKLVREKTNKGYRYVHGR